MDDLAEVLRSLPLGRRPRAGVVGNQHVRLMALALRHHAVLKPASSSSEDVNFRSARIDPSKNSISPPGDGLLPTQSEPHGQLGPAPRTAQTPVDLRERQPLGAGPVWPGHRGAGGRRNSRRASSSCSSVSARLLEMPRCSFRLGNSSALPLALTSAFGGGQGSARSSRGAASSRS
jgi:hypothetical protein